MIKVISKKVGGMCEVIEIENDLKTLQSCVGGLIEFYPLKDNIDIMINEEGKISGLEPNFAFNGELFVGDAIFIATDFTTGENMSLTDAQIDYILSM